MTSKKSRLPDGNIQPSPFTVAEWLRLRDIWMRQVLKSFHLKGAAKIVGIHIALRLSAKRPATYPALATIGLELNISPPTVERAIKNLKDEGFIEVINNKGKTSYLMLRF